MNVPLKGFYLFLGFERLRFMKSKTIVVCTLQIKRQKKRGKRGQGKEMKEN